MSFCVGEGKNVHINYHKLLILFKEIIIFFWAPLKARFFGG